MDRNYLKNLFEAVKSGSLDLDEAVGKLEHFPGESIDGACIDHQRQIRTGIPEVIFGESKSVEQIVTITRSMLKQPAPILVTRVDPEKARKVCTDIPEFIFHESARILQLRSAVVEDGRIRGEIVIICAGTSDLGIAEEARVTAQALGHPVQTIYDAGVAGLHRLLAHEALYRQASVIIVVAGMEGALPSVVGGLVSCPVIGVPASIGYGAGVGGFAALLGMLNSCAPGLAVVNIDNGFGAACMAVKINTNR
jgi:NCAIR mutase (PurE)-related protein